MTDQELRALVRDAVARHFTGAVPAPPELRTPNLELRTSVSAPHPSHAIYLTVVNSGDSCVIEPGVTCNHCGYCKSHGH
jgi:hypothetical protein